MVGAARAEPRHPAHRAAKQAPGIGAEDVVRRDRAPQLVERLDAAAKARAARGETRDVDAAGRDAGEDGDLEIGPQRREPAQDADLIRAASTAAGEEQGERAAVAGRHAQRIVVDARRCERGPAPYNRRHARLSRSRRHRQRPRRLRRRDPRRAARPHGHGGREGPASSAAPACTAAASRPRRCSTPPTCSRRRAAAPSSASPAPSRSSTSPRRTSTSRRWCARTPRASSSCSRRTRSRWLHGRGRLDGARTGRGRRATAASARSTPRHILIATGSVPRDAPVRCPFDGKRVLNSDHILELERCRSRSWSSAPAPWASSSRRCTPPSAPR